MSSAAKIRLILTLTMLLAGIAGYYVSHSTDRTVRAQPQKEKLTPKAKLNPLPENKPFLRSARNRQPPTGDGPTPPNALKNERIIQFSDDASYQKFLANLSERGLRLLGKSDLLRALRVGINSQSDLSNIDNAKLGYNYQVSLPTPPQANAQAGATGFGLTALEWLGVQGDNSRWGAGITVAVIDSGVNTHIALQGNITQIALTELPEGSAQLSHGTAVASIISGDHSMTPGVAPASEILSVRVSDETGSSNSFTLAEGILQAVDAGAKIINISMGSYGNSEMMADAVAYAQDQGAVIVASSGNEGLDTMAYPAAYEGVISVGAVEQGGEHLDFSNSGETLSTTAPGYEIYAAWGNEGLTAFSGTSASAPFISGAIAATMSENPQLSAQQAADLVVELSNDAGYPGADPSYGNGILDLGRIMDHGTPEIYDAAVTGQVMVQPSSPTALPEVWVTVQNQGTETLINSPVQITTPSGTQQLNISSLAPGQIKTFKSPLPLPYEGEATVTSSVQSQQGDKDSSNNTRTNQFSR